jgi:hypothetical protein
MAAEGRRPFTRFGLRAAGATGAALAALIGIGGGQALASAGCDAVNAGGFNDSITGGVSRRQIANFAAADTVTFVITIIGGGSWSLASGNNTPLDSQSASTIRSYIVSGNNFDTTLNQQIGGGGTTTVTATCVSGDSARLRTIQVAVTKIEAQASGDAISGAVGGAIADGFSDSGSLIRQNGGGLHFNFAAEPGQVRPDEGVGAFDAVMSARESVSREADWRAGGTGQALLHSHGRTEGGSMTRSARSPMPARCRPRHRR